MSVIKRAFSALGKLGIVIAIAIAFSAGLLGTIYYSLRSREVSVPNIVGKDVLEGEKALDQDGLNIRRRATRYSPSAKPNTILDQSPHAGEIVKVGQTVAVVVSRASAKEGEVSDPGSPEDNANTEDKNTNTESSIKNENENSNKANKNTRNKNSNNSNNGNANDRNLNRNSNANNANNRNANNRNANTGPANANRRTTNTNLNTNSGTRNQNSGRNNSNSNSNKRPAGPATPPAGQNRNRRSP